MIYLLIGEMGVGKNYVGERLANHLNCKFLDGDNLLPSHLKKGRGRFICRAVFNSPNPISR